MFKNFIARLFGFDRIIADLTALIKTQQAQLNVSRETSFVNVEVPQGEQIAKLNELLAQLGKDKLFAFYLTAQESELMAGFMAGKGTEGDSQVRGAMKLIKKIRGDIRSAANPKTEQDVNDPDYILRKIELLTKSKAE